MVGVPKKKTVDAGSKRSQNALQISRSSSPCEASINEIKMETRNENDENLSFDDAQSDSDHEAYNMIPKKEPTYDQEVNNSSKKKHQCSICNKVYRHKYRLESHMNSHSGLKPFSCNRCDQKFRYNHNLKNHKLRKHSRGPGFKCEICKSGKSYKSKSDLLLHQVVHKEKKLSCCYCGQMFHRRQQLINHEKIHAAIKDYICEVCDKKFVERGQLKLHMRVHSNERPYSCEVCKKRFKQLGHLNSHKITHADKKPFSCQFCTKTFTRNEKALKHKYTFHSHLL